MEEKKTVYTFKEALLREAEIIADLDKRKKEARQAEADYLSDIVSCDHMKLFVTNDHNGHYLPGTSIVIAENIEQAYKLLDKSLESEGLKPHTDKDKGYTLKEIPLDIEQALILFNGDY